MVTRTSALSMTLGALLLVGAPLGWQQAQPPDAVGVARTAPAVDGAGDVLGFPPQTPAGTGAAGVAATGGPDADGDEDAAPTRPIGLRIPAIDTDTPLDPVGLEPDGGMELPADVSRVGWYEPGVAPGQAGSAVLAGHVDSRTQGAGALFRLRELDVDDEIVTTTEEGEQRWRVASRVSYLKQALPIEELFSWEGPARLVVITCGGAFDAERGGYEENVVVHAVPW